MDQLAALMARRGLTAGDADALLFVSVEGAPLHYSNWRRRLWAPATATAGLSGLRFHDLRSLAATALVALGVNVKTAQTRLGHANPQTTLKLYARATIEADRSASDMVGEQFRPRDGRGMDGPPAQKRRPPKGRLTSAFVVGAAGLEPTTSAV
jgi:integrase